MIQYGSGDRLIGGDPDQVELQQQAAAAQQAQDQSRMTALLGLGVVVAGVWWFLKKRKRAA